MTSGNFSPVLERGIALALIDTKADASPLSAKATRSTLDVRGRHLPRPGHVLPFVAGRTPGRPHRRRTLMAGYAPHTEAEVASMLGFLGLSSLDELFDVVPEALRLAGGLDLPDGMPEPDAFAYLDDLARTNRPAGRDLVCFAGGGAYDHEVPPVTRALASRSEFVTSYTPYQPEVAQGVLQAVFEFQTLIARSDGDGGGQRLALRRCRRHRRGREPGRGRLGPQRRLGVTWSQPDLAGGAGHLRGRDRSPSGRRPPRRGDDAVGRGSTPPGDDRPGVVVVAYPNYLGCLEDLAAARDVCDRTGALLVVAFDPIAAGVLQSPAHWGADVVVGEGQALGMPLSFGGPYLGLFACGLAQVRRLPGRLVGETVDAEGRRAYVSTLRAREQDIRREKATSNVCTNQTLMAVTAAIQLGWLGTSGIAEVALRSARGRPLLPDASCSSVPGVEPLVAAPVLREFAVRLPLPAPGGDRATGRRGLPGRHRPRRRATPTGPTTASWWP